jgi:hypothetical protein
MLCLSFAPNIWAKPTGVAWWDNMEKTVRCLFNDPQDQMLAMSRLVGVQNLVQWESQVEKLSSRTPQGGSWDSAEISVAPDDWLKMLQRARTPAA